MRKETNVVTEIGGAKRDRTADLLHAMQALSQLSYGPIPATLNQRRWYLRWGLLTLPDGIIKPQNTKSGYFGKSLKPLRMIPKCNQFGIMHQINDRRPRC